jgi:hypothetical protein
MVICVKCGKEQSRRSSSQCEYYTINEEAGKEHAWEDREEFIDELREKLTPFIRERIAALRKNYAEKQALFTARLEPYRRRRDELRAEYAEFCNEWLPYYVEKEKQHAMRSLFINVIGGAAGFFIAYKWVLPKIFDITTLPFVILAISVLMVFLFGKFVIKFFKARRYAESQNYADDLADEWRDNNELDKAESDFEAEKDEWNKFSGSFERVIYDAERALAGTDEELLKFYNKDKRTKNWYIENKYEGEW